MNEQNLAVLEYENAALKRELDEWRRLCANLAYQYVRFSGIKPFAYHVHPSKMKGIAGLFFQRNSCRTTYHE